MDFTIFTIQYEKEVDGRIIADIPQLPGVMVYGKDDSDALKKVLSLAFSVLADMARSGELSLPITIKEAA